MAELGDDDAGGLQIGVTDHDMVRLIITNRNGVIELDYEVEDAIEIADEIRAAAERLSTKRSAK
ncbi:MAG: hypothetical protein KTR21_06230 [Rhodobacteraceae bacterium]|nr:hypothetical protein [Paracoccaceae bacterium]